MPRNFLELTPFGAVYTELRAVSLCWRKPQIRRQEDFMVGKKRRYYFHAMRGDVPEVIDVVGIDLADDDTALREGRLALSELTESEELIPDDLEVDSIRIVDDLGRVVGVLRIAGLTGAHRRLISVLAYGWMCSLFLGERLMHKAPEVLSHLSTLGS